MNKFNSVSTGGSTGKLAVNLQLMEEKSSNLVFVLLWLKGNKYQEYPGSGDPALCEPS